MPSPIHANAQLGTDLHLLLPPERVSQQAADRMIYSRDMWPRTLLAVRDNKPSVNPPDYIVWPETTEEVAEILRLANRAKVPVVPWGGGSGVCGGAMTSQGGILLDLKRMAQVHAVSSNSYLATAQCGVIGQTLEDKLNLQGLTLGHFPASIYISTLGGWLAARSAGQFSSKYGKIEDMVQEIEVVLGDGEVLRCTLEQQPSLIPLFVGSEGTLGVITQATLRVHPLPDYRIFRAYQFSRVAAGAEAMRRVMQLGLKPAVLRLYDETDSILARSSGQGKTKSQVLDLLDRSLPTSKNAFGSELKNRLMAAALTRASSLSWMAERVMPHLSSGCMAIIGFEGEPALVNTEASLCHTTFLSAGAKDLGEEPGLAWYSRRYAISYKQSPLYANTNGFVDTMEVASTWDRLMGLYTEVRLALSSRALVLAHFSHAYPEGCSIYFTFAAAAPNRIKAESLYDEIWHKGLAAVLKAGGTISHHHGVGLSKANYMAEEHGTTLAVYRQLKSIMDPTGILNPGKMGL